MTRARNLANLGNKNAITADIGLFNIGIGSTQPTNYKLEVVGGNAYVGGGVTITGNLSVGGTITYEDVTNVDAVGIITAAKGFRATAGGVVVTAGVSTFPVVAVSVATTTKDLLVTGVTTFRDTVNISTGQLDINDSIRHVNDTNTKISFTGSDVITATTGGTERLRIASDGDVIIGGSSDAGYADYADNLTIHDTQNSGITIRSGIASQGAVYFSDATGTAAGTYVGNIIYDHSDNHMRFATSGSERLRIDSSGRLLVGHTSSNDSANFAPVFQIEGTDSVDSSMSLIRNGANAHPPYLTFGKTRGYVDRFN